MHFILNFSHKNLNRNVTAKAIDVHLNQIKFKCINAKNVLKFIGQLEVGQNALKSAVEELNVD